MFKLKTNLLFFRIVLFIGLGFFLIINNHQVMAMNNLNDENSINNEINKLYLERKELAAKISYFDIYHLDDDIKLKTKLHNLDQTIKNLYQRLADVKNLKCINEKIWDYSYEQNQIANTILSRPYQDPTIQELITNHKKLVKIIKNLNQKYINLQYKLNK